MMYWKLKIYSFVNFVALRERLGECIQFLNDHCFVSSLLHIFGIVSKGKKVYFSLSLHSSIQTTSDFKWIEDFHVSDLIPLQNSQYQY